MDDQVCPMSVFLPTSGTGCPFRQAERANSGGESRGYDTNHDTKRDAAQPILPQVLGNMVELVGIEPTTSSLRTMRSPS